MEDTKPSSSSKNLDQVQLLSLPQASHQQSESHTSHTKEYLQDFPQCTPGLLSSAALASPHSTNNLPAPHLRYPVRVMSVVQTVAR